MTTYNLMRGRLIVLPDAGSSNTGTVVQSNLGMYRGLYMPREDAPGDPNDPWLSRVYNNHIVFVPEMTTEIEIDGITHKVMNMDAVVALISD